MIQVYEKVTVTVLISFLNYLYILAIEADRVEMILPFALDERKSTVVSGNETSCIDFESRYHVNPISKSSTVISLVDLQKVQIEHANKFKILRNIRSSSRINDMIRSHAAERDKSDSIPDNDPTQYTGRTNSTTDNTSVIFMADTNTDNTDHSDDMEVVDNSNEIVIHHCATNDKTVNNDKIDDADNIIIEDSNNDVNIATADIKDVIVNDGSTDKDKNGENNFDSTDLYCQHF